MQTISTTPLMNLIFAHVMLKLCTYNVFVAQYQITHDFDLNSQCINYRQRSPESFVFPEVLTSSIVSTNLMMIRQLVSESTVN
jgi:hypothetical protein